MKITINDRVLEAAEGQTVLQIAQANKIVIPVLCHHRALSPSGSCRMCLVEVEGLRGQLAACTLQSADGMVVHTETPALLESRRLLLELLLRNYVESDTAADDTHVSELHYWVAHYGVPMPIASKPRYPVDSDPNPFIHVDLNKCILCTRCVRACAEIQGRFVWGVGFRGDQAKIVAGADTTMLEARCESCGACVAVCPTGALADRMSMGKGTADKVVATTCTYCGVGCRLNLIVKGNRIIRVTSNPDAPVNGIALCVKGRYGYDFVHHPERLKAPRARRYLLEGRAKPKPSVADPQWDWIDVGWDTALNLAARRLREARDTFGADSVGVLASAKCLNEENYLMNKFARQAIGTNGIDHCARL